MKNSVMTSISKYMSLILRHKPHVIGIELDRYGWADTNELIKGIAQKYSGFDMSLLEEIVKKDSKQRYSLNEDKTKIRANQGHSVRVDVELKITAPPQILYHGTAQSLAPSISSKGILHRQRLYVHLSSDIGTAILVGQRHGSPVVFEVDSGAMARDGYVFYLSENGVWLTEYVPAKYLSLMKRK